MFFAKLLISSQLVVLTFGAFSGAFCILGCEREGKRKNARCLGVRTLRMVRVYSVFDSYKFSICSGVRMRAERTTSLSTPAAIILQALIECITVIADDSELSLR